MSGCSRPAADAAIRIAGYEVAGTRTQTMSKRQSLEDRLAALQAVADDPGAGGPGALRKGLQSRTSFVAAKAVEVVAELEWIELLPDLAAKTPRPQDTGTPHRGVIRGSTLDI